MKWLKKRVVILVLYAFGIGLLLFTSPKRISLVFLLTPLVLLYLAVFLSLKLAARQFVKEPGRRLSRRTTVLLALTLAFPVVLLLLQSIGQLSLRDVITLVLIMSLLGFYVTKVKFGRSS